MKINDLIGLLVSAYHEWGSVLANPRYCRKGNTISWIDFKEARVSDPVTIEDIAKLADQRQYSFQIAEDGSILQMYYEFDIPGSKLLSASLAFYKYPDNFLSNQIIESDELIKQENIEDMLDNRKSLIFDHIMQCAWFRMDYDPTIERGVIHPKSHLHFHGFPKGRIFLKGIPNPRQFIEFVILIAYPEIYAQKRLHDNGEYLDPERIVKVNENTVCVEYEGLEKHISHLSIPI